MSIPGDDELMDQLKESLERLDPAPAAAVPDPALLARIARDRAGAGPHQTTRAADAGTRGAPPGEPRPGSTSSGRAAPPVAALPDRTPAAPAHGSTDPRPVVRGAVPLAAAPFGGQGRLVSTLVGRWRRRRLAGRVERWHAARAARAERALTGYVSRLGEWEHR